MNIEQLEKKKLEIEKKIELLKEKQTSLNWYEYKKGWEIYTKQCYNGLTYAQILNKVKEENIADYPLLQELRNKGLNFLKEFWVFVPNPDKISKKKFVARFIADSDWANLDCDWYPTDTDPSLGVFLIRRKK